MVEMGSAEGREEESVKDSDVESVAEGGRNIDWKEN